MTFSLEQQIMKEKRQSAQSDLNELQELKAKVEKFQRALDESYDIIDEMDFELESVRGDYKVSKGLTNSSLFKGGFTGNAKSKLTR